MRDLVKNYLLDAVAFGGATTALQVAWLEEKRQELSALVDGGDWAVSGQSFEGTSSSQSRGISARERLAAIIACMEKLNGTGGGGGGSLILPRLGCIPH